MRVATVTASTSEGYLRGRGIGYQAFGSVGEALQALANGSQDAVVYDAPILRYLAVHELDGVQVLPRTFARQDYAIALPEGSPLREPIGRDLLRRISEPGWRDVLVRYTGAIER